MIRILLVDDELLVRTGLKLLIDWEAEGFVVVGEAANGNEALELVETLSPDVVLTDILMPEKNGIEMMKELRDRNFAGKVAILSNHDDFSYTREALRNGAADYILKSDLNRESFLSFIRSLGKQVSAGSRLSGQDRDPGHIQNRLKEILLEPSGEIRLRSIESLPARWKERSFRTAVIQIKSPSAGNEEKLKIYQLASGILTPDKALFFDPGPRGLYWIVLFHGNREDLGDEKLAALERRLKNSLSTYLGLPVFTGIGETVQDCRELYGCYRRLEETLWDSFFHHDRSVLFQTGPESRSPGKERNRNIHEKISRLLAYGTPETEREELMNGIFRLLEEEKDPCVLKNFSLRFVGYLNQQNARLAVETSGNSPHQFFLDSLWQLSTLDDLRELFLDALQGLEDRKGEQPMDLIGRTLKFIDGHIAEPVSLTDAAEHAGLSRSYFSSWFKEKTGEKFSDFLIARRIERARRLLDTRPELRIYEIAALTGIRNEKYFSRMFKSQTGLSPRDYRNRRNQIGISGTPVPETAEGL